MSDLKTLIEQCIEMQPETPSYARDFALFYLPKGGWEAVIGGCSSVMLGEYHGDFFGAGKTPEEAVSALLEVLRQQPAAVERPTFGV